MRVGIFTVAAMAAMLAIPAAHAATAQVPENLFKSTADHSRFKALQQHFNSGPEVTKACLSCHTEASKQLHQTQHWKWEYRSPEGQLLGKKNVINNFCTSVASNEAFCNTCHIGYGWKDDKFDFTSEVNVDCLVCHDSTGNYQKPAGLAGNVVTKPMEFPPGSGNMIKPINLKKIAQAVGKTSRDNCGACHFFGGGGDGVKHGDMDSSLASPDKALDVHMDATGSNFACATCHMTEGHQVPGSRYAPTAQDKGGAHLRGKEYTSNPATCQSCHGQEPHKANAKLNDHTDKVACQTCHIPAYARGGVPTKMSWDWSTAGKDGPVAKDEYGLPIYDKQKGDFKWAKDIKPTYMWFNGSVDHYLAGDKMDPAKVTHLNYPRGDRRDNTALITPFKVMQGKQPYDSGNDVFAVPNLWGGYWGHWDWNKAIADGMKAAGLDYSGQYGFAPTDMYWKVNHMVVPKAQALKCNDCHSKEGQLDWKALGYPGDPQLTKK